MSEEGGSAASPRYLLDTSAMMAMLQEEPGANRVREILQSEAVLLPFLVTLEVYYITAQKEGDQIASDRQTMLKALKVEHLETVDEAVLLAAGQFQARHALSLADALIAAFAYRHDAVLVHKDPEYESLRGMVRQEPLPYRSRRRR